MVKNIILVENERYNEIKSLIWNDLGCLYRRINKNNEAFFYFKQSI